MSTENAKAWSLFYIGDSALNLKLQFQYCMLIKNKSDCISIIIIIIMNDIALLFYVNVL